MKKIKYILVLFIFCLTFNVKAIDECTNEEMNRLRNLANQVEFKLDYSIEEKKVEGENGNEEIDDVWANYKINVVNDNQDLRYYLKRNNGDEKELIDSNTLSNYTFSDGQKLTIQIYSYTANLCTNELLRTVSVDLPEYNIYYYDNKERCKEYPEFKYCKEFMSVDKDNQKIDKLFNEYINNKNGIINSNTTNNFIKNNKYIIIGISSLIIIGIVIFIIFKIKNKKEKI